MKQRIPARSVRPEAPRDAQARSPFAAILDRLLDATPGGAAAVLVDSVGETVDYTGAFDPYDLKVTAAHWQIVVAELAQTARLGSARQIVVRARARSYIIRRIHDDYVIVLIVHRMAAFAFSERAMQEAEERLRVEAGWPAPAVPTHWFQVEVQTLPGLEGRPSRLRGTAGWQDVEIMGAMVGLPRRERGFRVRLQTGAEMILVQERFGRWFADEYQGG